MAEAPELEDGQDRLVTEVLRYCAQALVEHTDEVRVTFEAGDRNLYRLTVHPDDTGRIIGRGGRVARALRAIGKAAAAKSGVHAFIRIGDERE